MKNNSLENSELVSIIIPTWNRYETLSRAINSAINQTYSFIEILVCDDGSTDKSEELVKSYSDKRIKWIPGPHSGLPGLVRNRGIRIAKGNLLAFLDSDDEWHPKKLELQLKYLYLNNSNAVVSNAINIPSYKKEKTELLKNILKKKIKLFDLIIENKIITSSCLIKKDLIKKIDYFPESKRLKAYEDVAYWYRVSSITDFDFIDKSLLNYFDSPNESIRSLVPKHYKAIFFVFIDFFWWSLKNNKLYFFHNFVVVIYAFIVKFLQIIFFKILKYLFLLKKFITKNNFQIKDTPLISVIMPVYNGANYLKESIDSILIQSYSNFELIIVDDFSTDDSLLILQSFSDKRIRIYRNSYNKGIVKSLNIAISKSKGSFIARMDADDISHPDRLKIQLNYLINNPNIGIVGSWVQCFGQNIKRFIHRYPVYNETIKASMIFENPLAHPSVLIRKKILKNIFYSSQYKFVEDWELWFRLSSKNNFHNLPKILLFYRIHDKSLSKTNSLTQNKFKKKFAKDLYHDLNLPFKDFFIEDKLIWSKDLCVNYYMALNDLFLKNNIFDQAVLKNVLQNRLNFFLLRYSKSPFFSIKFFINNKFFNESYMKTFKLLISIFMYSIFRYFRSLFFK